MPDRHIRVVARGLVRRERDGDEQLLVARDRDPEAGDAFHYLLGGGVRFGEHSADALRREFREELGVELASVSHAGTYEDVFAFDGETRHEVWRVYEVDIADDWPYERDAFTAHEPEFDEDIDCVWRSVSELGSEDGGGDTLYPEGVLDEP